MHHQPPFISLILATIENQNIVPKGGSYNLFMITDPHLTALGAAADEFQNFKMLEPDGENSRNLKKTVSEEL